MAFSILTDTSANLPTELVKRYGISVTPFSFFVEGKESTCTDSESFDGPAFYDAMRHGAIVTTSQVNPQRHMDYMEPILKQGSDLLYVCMSSGISGAYSCAEMAAAQLLTAGAQCPVRLFYKVTGRRGETLGRGFAVIANPQRADAELPTGTLLEGITNLRLLDHAAAYRDFGKLVFLSRGDFEAVSAELRDRER